MYAKNTKYTKPKEYNIIEIEVLTPDVRLLSVAMIDMIDKDPIKNTNASNIKNTLNPGDSIWVVRYKNTQAIPKIMITIPISK